MNDANGIGQRATAMIGRRNGRVTAARVATLTALLGAKRALTHEEISDVLARAGGGIDRVTLYRVLDWLVDNGLAHKVAGVNRAWHFNAAVDEAAPHAHFECNDCHTIYCLESARPAVAVSLPQGFQLDHAELMLNGRCAACRA
jgi:Fur family ferric uptake transcriptional regulator